MSIPSSQASSSSPSARSADTVQSRRWLQLSVCLAVALAFADASIAVLALPQIIERLHTTISHVVWVIAAYNLALIAGCLAVLPIARRLPARESLLTGLAVFGVASIGSGVSGSLKVLVVLRVAQGAGGALLLCASLPMFTEAGRDGTSPLSGWAAAAAIGAAVGPAVGGLLTQVFDWRAIFLAQAPVAALAALAVTAAHRRKSANLGAPAGASASAPVDVPPDRPAAADPAVAPRARLHPVTANLALALLSAGLIGALFLTTILLINVWLLSPLAAAGVVSSIPLSTAVTERFTRSRPARGLAATGAVALAAGLLELSLVSHKQLGVAVVGLILCGAGLGLGFPSLTQSALRSTGTQLARAARTVAARDAGLVIGLLVLTPVFVDRLNAAQTSAIAPITRAVLQAPFPLAQKEQLGGGLAAANASTPQSRLPDFTEAFTKVSATASQPVRGQLATLKTQLDSLVQRAATQSFHRPLRYCAVFALLVLPLLLLSAAFDRRRPGSGSPLPPAAAGARAP